MNPGKLLSNHCFCPSFKLFYKELKITHAFTGDSPPNFSFYIFYIWTKNNLIAVEFVLLKKSLVSVEPNLLQAHCEMMTIWPTKDFHAEIVSNKSWHRSGRYIHCPWYNFLFFKAIFANAFANSLYDWIGSNHTRATTLAVINWRRLGERTFSRY